MKSKATILAAADQAAPVIHLIPANQITRYPTNRTPTEDSIKTMADSIREHGVIQHILARPIPAQNLADPSSDPALQLIFGETRWRACLTIDPAYPIPCRVQELDDREAAKIHAIENFQRKDLTPCEQARELRHLLDVGWNLDEVMTHVSRAKDWCYRRLSILSLPPEGQEAVDSGALPVKVAAKIAELPADLRADAVRSCVTPTHSATPLNERDALHLLQKAFLEPLQKAQDWKAKKKLLLRENPGSTFLDFEEAEAARGHNSDYEPAHERPSFHLLSDAANNDEIPVPTWGELAAKHQAPTYIGLDWKGETTLYVKPEPIVEAEKAAFRQKPGDCVFLIEDHHGDLKAAAERRRMQSQADAARHAEEMRTISAEIHTICRGILKPTAKQNTAGRQRTLAEAAFLQLREDLYASEFPEILQIEPEENETPEDLHERSLDHLRNLLRDPKASPNPLEDIGRIYLVTCLYGRPGVITPALHAMLQNHQQTTPDPDQEEEDA
jgi:ParB/RepB/Spo0J family partition protein